MTTKTKGWSPATKHDPNSGITYFEVRICYAVAFRLGCFATGTTPAQAYETLQGMVAGAKRKTLHKETKMYVLPAGATHHGFGMGPAWLGAKGSATYLHYVDGAWVESDESDES